MSKFVITAGHDSVKDPGAVSTLNGVQYTEAKLMTELRNLVKFYLEKVGHTVISDGTGDTNKVLREAIVLIPQGIVAVELHLNAATAKTAKGVETIGNSKRTSKPFPPAPQSKLNWPWCNWAISAAMASPSPVPSPVAPWAR